MTADRVRTLVKENAPRSLLPLLYRVAKSKAIARWRRRPRWGNLRRDRPFSEHQGDDRGTRIERWYIDSFLAANGPHIHGHVLVTRHSQDARRFREGIARLDVLDANERNLDLTLLGDLGIAGTLPAGVYDCVICTQTLQGVVEVEIAMQNLWASLKPGGRLLLSVPSIAAYESNEQGPDAWRFLPAGLGALVERTCEPTPTEVDLETHGNLVVVLASLLGLSADELTPAELSRPDPNYPLLLTASIAKP